MQRESDNSEIARNVNCENVSPYKIKEIVPEIRVFCAQSSRRIPRFLNFFIACKSAEKCPGSSPSHSAYLKPC